MILILTVWGLAYVIVFKTIVYASTGHMWILAIAAPLSLLSMSYVLVCAYTKHFRRIVSYNLHHQWATSFIHEDSENLLPWWKRFWNGFHSGWWLTQKLVSPIGGEEMDGKS